MQLAGLDWCLSLGSLPWRRALAKAGGKELSDFFLSGRNMPWWLRGVSMVYTALFATGFWLCGNTLPAILLSTVALMSGIVLFKLRERK